MLITLLIITIVIALLLAFERERQARAKHRAAVRSQLMRLCLAQYAPARR